MTAPERIIGFLTEQRGLDWCDKCLASELGMSPEDVEDITQALAGSANFLRDAWRCIRCTETTKVTRALSSAVRRAS